MEIGELQGFIIDYMETGLTFEQAAEEAFATKDEVEEMKKDSFFMGQVRRKILAKKAELLKQWSEKVKGSMNPADTLKKLQVISPDMFEPKGKDEMPVQPFNIMAGDGSIEEVIEE